MQHCSRDPESSWLDRDVHDRYALCALTGTAFSIICEFRANFELRASLCSRLFLFHSSSIRRVLFFFSQLPHPSFPSRFGHLSRSVSLSAFSTFGAYKSIHDISRVTRTLCSLSLVPTWLHQLHDCNDTVRTSDDVTPNDAGQKATNRRGPSLCLPVDVGIFWFFHRICIAVFSPSQR